MSEEKESEFSSELAIYNANLEQKQSANEISKIYNHGLEYNKFAEFKNLENNLAQAAQSMYECGRSLILIKEHSKEDYQEALKIFHLTQRHARRFMHLAEKLKERNLFELSQLSRTKLFDLMTLEEVDIDDISDGKQIAGFTKEDIEKAPVRTAQKIIKVIKNRNDKTVIGLNKEIADLKSVMSAQSKIADKQSIERGKLEQQIETLKIEKENALKPSEETDNKKIIELDIAVSRVAAAAMDEILKLDEFRGQIQMLNAEDIEENPQYQRLQSTCLDSAKIILTSAASLFDELEALFGEDFSIQDENFRTVIATLNAKINLPE